MRVGSPCPAAFLCIGIGVFPGPLYAILPFPVDFVPYTVTHVITQLQLLLFSALAFAVLMRTGIYPPELRSVNLDTDGIYRKALPVVAVGIGHLVSAMRVRAVAAASRSFDRMLVVVFHYHGPNGLLARNWPIGGAALCVIAMLGGFLIFYYF